MALAGLGNGAIIGINKVLETLAHARFLNFK
jgi:hypothetical protein